eukprot:CAMPEP_0118813718 /NCGR_PEP_ID=MMETSP1162-20130426/3119_1 /TAXON_ID=33656 /ORGANISM="Phaeocystis Sp, Strain CCMP2710" /LENGTH=78 /DNA_ID=CAMNT_0006743543 /DNA_START=20 /DNA_END=256 /DNA_ORIENTATION=-
MAEDEGSRFLTPGSCFPKALDDELMQLAHLVENANRTYRSAVKKNENETDLMFKKCALRSSLENVCAYVKALKEREGA